MRGAVLRAGEIQVRDDLPEPRPALGQVLVQVKACGICGSDLHFARHGGTMLALGGLVDYLTGGSDELYQRAKKVGIPGRSSMTKGQLVDALRNH